MKKEIFSYTSYITYTVSFQYTVLNSVVHWIRRCCVEQSVSELPEFFKSLTVCQEQHTEFLIAVKGACYRAGHTSNRVCIAA